MYLIAGLGNIGLKYKKTRHNVGFQVVEQLCQRNHIRMGKKQFRAKTGMGYIGDSPVLVIKPETYMNLSGYSVVEARDYYRIDGQQLIVIYDDIDLEVGKIRIKGKGSAGTHNGMRSVIQELGTQEFIRVRVGIGKAPGYMKLAGYVLGKFSKEETEIMEQAYVNAARAVEEIIQNGLMSAQSKYNG